MPTWKHGGNWTMSLLSWTVFSTMYRDGRDCNPMFLEFKNDVSSYYQTEEALNSVKQEIVKRIKRNPIFIKKKLIDVTVQLKQDKDLLHHINKRLKTKKKNLDKLFKEYWDSYKKTVFGMAIDIYFDDIVVENIKGYLEQRLLELRKEGKFHEYYSVLTTPQKKTTTQKEEESFLNILLQPKNIQDVLFRKHLKKYTFIPMWFDNEPWTISDIKKRTAVYKNKKDINRRLDEVRSDILKRKRQVNKIITDLQIPSEIIKIIREVQKFAYLRQEGEAQIGYHNYHGLPLKQRICERLGISLYDLKYLTDEEVIDNLRKRNSQLPQIVKRRQNYCFMIMKNGKYYIYTGSEARERVYKIKKRISVQKVGREKFINGVVGSPGVIRGRAKILKSLNDIGKVKKGDIMIVSGTSLEYISAMQKASGVVAEIGGITSHAAVTCRELHKPCLTRVDKAVKRFKDGEMVELNAQEGFIKKL